MVNKKRLIQQFLDLVQIDSETYEEGKISAYLKEKFQRLGLEVTEDDAKEKTNLGANNLICTLRGNLHHSTSIFFSSHMDTVSPGKMIKPTIQNGFITSDGTTILGADDKAGIAAMIELIHILQENNAIPFADLQFIITVGEEAGLSGAKVIDRSLITAQQGYVVDSDGPVGNVVSKAPYQTKMYATINGKAAHAGVAPEKGISAITVAAKSIAKMQLGRIDAETTANISFFKGGIKAKTNVVTHFVEIEGEARSLRKHKLENVKDKLRKAFFDTAETYGTTAEVNFEDSYPGYVIEPSHPLVTTVQKAATRLKLPFATVQSGGGSDANIFNQLGLPTINLAVGYEHIHTTEERIEIDELVRLTNLLVEIIKETYR